MKEVSEQVGYYNPRTNEQLRKYIGKCLKERIDPAFIGNKFYKRLCKKGYLIPDLSFIEIIRDSGLAGKRYLVRESYKLMSGDGRLHNPETVLREESIWEARHLARHIRRLGEPARFIN